MKHSSEWREKTANRYSFHDDVYTDGEGTSLGIDAWFIIQRQRDALTFSLFRDVDLSDLYEEGIGL